MRLQGVVYPVITYLQNNALNIVGTLILGLIGAYFTQRYIKKEVTSARQERLDQAKTNLLDVLEMQVINDKEITEEKIENLMSAVDRKYSVSLSVNLSLIDILQDVELRIEESRHLSPSDKEEYSSKIESQISAIKQSNKTAELPEQQSNAVKELEKAIEEDNTQLALETLDDFKSYLQDRRHATAPTVTGGLIGWFFGQNGLQSFPPERRRRILLSMALSGAVYLLMVFFFIIR